MGEERTGNQYKDAGKWGGGPGGLNWGMGEVVAPSTVAREVNAPRKEGGTGTTPKRRGSGKDRGTEVS